MEPLFSVRCQVQLTGVVKPFREEFEWPLPLVSILVDGMDVDVETVSSFHVDIPNLHILSHHEVS